MTGRLSSDDAELVRHLFARVAALLEDAHLVASEGQAHSAGAQMRLAEAIRRDAERLTALAVAIIAIASPRQQG